MTMTTIPRCAGACLALAFVLGVPASGSAQRSQAAVAAPDPERASPECTVSMEVYDDHVYVPVTVEGGGARTFILDSGASSSVLDRGLADAMGREVSPMPPIRGAGGAMAAGTADGVSVDMGACQFVIPTVLVLPLDSVIAPFAGRPLPGILGSEVFRDHVVEVDYAGGEVRLFQPDGYTPPPGAVEVQVRLLGGLAQVDATLQLADGQTYDVELILDLGAKRVLFTTPFVRRTGVVEHLTRSIEGTIGAGVGGESRFRMARAGELQVGALTMDAPVLGFSEGSGLDLPVADGVLGTSFFRRYTVIFDYARGRVLFVARPGPLEPDDFDMSGLTLVADSGGGVRVHRVLPSSPAAEVGIQVGDHITRVDGAPVARYTLSDLRLLLAREPGSEHELVLTRAGADIPLTLRLRRLV